MTFSWSSVTMGSSTRYVSSKVKKNSEGQIRTGIRPPSIEAALTLPTDSKKIFFNIEELEIPKRTTDWVHDKNWDLLFNPHVENVIGTDDSRIQVKNATLWPYCAIGALAIEFPQGKGTGSGSLVDDNFVLTAAHCIYLKEYGGWIRAAKFAPGAGGGNKPFGVSTITKCWVPQPWIESQDSNFDFAIVALDRGFSNKVGCFGLSAIDDGTLVKSEVLIAGYPSDKGGMDQYFAVDKLISVDKARLHYLIDSCKGQSGTGIIRKEKDEYANIVGVHTYGSNIENSGTRVTEAWLLEFDKVMSGKY